MDTEPKKALGQHWLSNKKILGSIVDFAEVSVSDTVFEIGPGLGTLTAVLAGRVKHIVALEYDNELASQLIQGRTLQGLENVQIEQGDIRTFDLTTLPADYSVVANIPYYLTGEILRLFTESSRSPRALTLLVQKEVAERWAARPGQMSLSAVAAQMFGNVTLGPIVFAASFTPPPKVDSQVVRIVRHNQPLFPDIDQKQFWQVVKAGFSAKRKQLRSSLSGGLHLSKPEVEALLAAAHISPTARAQELSLSDWHTLNLLLTNQ